MDFNGVFGEICDPRGTLFMEWKIPNYFSMPQKTDSYMDSPMFQFSDSTWFLSIYPNGRRADNSINSIELCLSCLNDSPYKNYILTINCGIKLFNGKVINFGPFQRAFNTRSYVHSWYLIRRSELKRFQNNYVPYGTLTLYCIGKLSSAVTDASSQTILQDNTSSLSHDFQDLYLSGQKSDVTLQVRGCAFRAHRLILETRSSVFAAMFQHNMKEENNGIVHISNCDLVAFHNFLLFMYTGKLENLSSDNVIDLFTIADKYGVKELKENCAKFMMNNLTVNTVCDVIAIADRYNEMELRNSAKNLLVRNMKTILPTENWTSFNTENPVLALEILMTVIPSDF